jgi:hypothetical protein
MKLLKWHVGPSTHKSGRVMTVNPLGSGVKWLAKQQRSGALVVIQLIHCTHEKICACKNSIFGAAH